MIERILLALDVDEDTPVATSYALEIAQRHSAKVTGLACVDTEQIESSSAGGGIGSMYYAEKIRNRLTDESRKSAERLLERFDKAAKKKGIAHAELVQEGVTFERIIEDLKYHDLLVIGNDGHFFYANPKKKTPILERVVKESVAPVILVPEEYREINRVLLSYDGSGPSARAMQRFAQMRPFGNDVHVRVVNIFKSPRHGHEAELLVGYASRYLESHGFTTTTATLCGDNPSHEILAYSKQVESDLVVAGAHSVSKMKKLAFGSTTARLIKEGAIPMFLER